MAIREIVLKNGGDIQPDKVNTSKNKTQLEGITQTEKAAKDKDLIISKLETKYMIVQHGQLKQNVEGKQYCFASTIKINIHGRIAMYLKSKLYCRKYKLVLKKIKLNH